MLRRDKILTPEERTRLLDSKSWTVEEHELLLDAEEREWREERVPGWQALVADLDRREEELLADREALDKRFFQEGELKGAVSIEPHIRLAMRYKGWTREVAVKAIMDAFTTNRKD